MKRLIILAALCAGLAGLPAWGQENEQEKQDSAGAISKMIGGGELDEAKARIEAIVANDSESAETVGLRRALATQYARKGDWAASTGQLSTILDFEMAHLDDEGSAAGMVGTTSMMLSLMARQQRGDEAIELVDKAIAALKPKTGKSLAMTEAMIGLMRNKANGLRMNGNTQEAVAQLQGMVAMAEELANANPDDGAATGLLISTLVSRMVADADKKDADFAKIENICNKRLAAEPGNADIANAYISAIMINAQSQSRDNPDVAEAMLNKAKEVITSVVNANEDAKGKFANVERQFASLERTIESARKLAKLIDQPMPAWDVKYWAHGAGFSPEDLKGKVVLLDFWAIWCGPCIATFPHLKEWQEEFGSEGFQVVGVTRAYHYHWDDAAARAVRNEEEKKNTDDEESAMLDAFMNHHQLLHPTMVTPDASQMSSEYGVTGIPHAVLIDRKGMVRMIKVGSGEANANALHEKIKELLAEKAE